MEPEEIAVAPNEENGNVPLETSSEQPKEPVVLTEESKEPAQPAVTPEPVLVELPDGRKVDAQTVAQEYKNLLSDYTKKSQALAEIEKSKINQTSVDLADPNYQPQTYDELAQQIEARLAAKTEAQERAKFEQEQARISATVEQLNEVLAIDPSLKGNEGTLFVHATKYGFKDLKLAHQNMKDMSEAIKKAQTVTAQNIAKRNDPVSTTQGAPAGGKPAPNNFGSAVDYYRSINK